MSPMPNSRYFQPMVHRPLPDIRKYVLLTNQNTEFFAVIKPEGIDVFVNDGKLYDFNQNEIKNQYLQFHFERLLQTSVNMKATIVGTLTAENTTMLKRYRHTIYNPTRSKITDVKFFVYDIVFPVFNVDHVYSMRFDVASKVIGELPNCQACSIQTVKNEHDLNEVVKDLFSINTGASVLVYDKEGKFAPGMSQLTWNDDETASYIVEAKQRYRAHVKKVVSTTLRMEDGNKLDVALLIIAKFKKEFVEIPVDLSNIALRTFIWQNRLTLKDTPFWFTGYTILDNKGDSVDYVTIIHEFFSFITPTE
jgi:hypothetical protein